MRIRHQHWAPEMDIALTLWNIFERHADIIPPAQPVESAPTYSGDLDAERLTSQLDAVLALMQDGMWRTQSEIRAAIGRGSEAGLSARLREIRNSRRGVVERRRRGDPKNGLHEYRMVSL